MTDSLICRLQSLTSPSREIDAEIALANGWQTTFARTVWMNPDKHLDHEPPRYTESLDTALTLVPKDATWRVENYFAPPADGFEATLWYGAPPDDEVTIGHGPTPAIALLIAIMKAKEESKP